MGTVVHTECSCAPRVPQVRTIGLGPCIPFPLLWALVTIRDGSLHPACEGEQGLTALCLTHPEALRVRPLNSESRDLAFVYTSDVPRCLGCSRIWGNERRGANVFFLNRDFWPVGERPRIGTAGWNGSSLPSVCEKRSCRSPKAGPSSLPPGCPCPTVTCRLFAFSVACAGLAGVMILMVV